MGNIPLIFKGFVFDSIGIGESSRNMLWQLHLSGRFDIQLINLSSNFPKDGFSDEQQQLFYSLSRRTLDPSTAISFSVTTPSEFISNCRKNVGYTTFETDRVPSTWLPALDSMDLICVPSIYNKETFLRSGVKTRVSVIPHGSSFLGVGGELPPDSRYSGKPTFIMCGTSQYRKGIDVGLRAFFRAFGRDRGCRLILKVSTHDPALERTKVESIIQEIRAEFPGKNPDILVITEHLNRQELISLYRAGIALILPSRGEGWGLTGSDAVSLGVPVVITGWSGPLMYIPSERYGYHIDYTFSEVSMMGGNPAYDVAQNEKHRWAEPSVEDLARIMLEIYRNPGEAKSRALKAQDYLKDNFTWGSVGENLVRQIESVYYGEIPSQGNYLSDRKIIFSGGIMNRSGYGRMGGEFFLAAANSGRYNTKIFIPPGTPIPSEYEEGDSDTFNAALSNQKLGFDDSMVVNIITPNAYKSLPAGKINVGYAICETNSVPPSWVEGCNSMDALITNTEFNKKALIGSGVTSPIYVVPGGIDTPSYNNGKVHSFDDGKFNFLFSGTNQPRKGMHRVIKAFIQEFGNNEGTRLILKVTPETDAEGVKNKITHILEFCKSIYGHFKSSVVLISDHISKERLSELYNTSHAFVFPSSGEAWGLTMTEAICHGLPIIATNWSSMAEILDDRTAYMLDYDLVGITSDPLNPQYREEYLEAMRNGHKWAEPRHDHLCQLMREVYNNYGEARAKALAAKELANTLSWEKTHKGFLDALDRIYLSHAAKK